MSLVTGSRSPPIFVDSRLRGSLPRMKNIAQKLEKELAKAVSLIVTASHAAARDVLDEAFGATPRGGDSASSGGGRRRHRSPRGPAAPRRTREELAALERQLLEAVWATPGEPMSVLATRVGVSPSTLQVPVARLKAAGQLRTVGSRQFTRYFPAGRDTEISAVTEA